MTAIRFDIIGVEAAEWVADFGGPHPKLYPEWPPPTGHSAIVLVEYVAADGGPDYEGTYLILTAAAMAKIGGADVTRKKLFCVVPSQALADAVPAVARLIFDV